MSTKNPRYPDLMHVEPLVGPFTINTMPEETIAACREHGTTQLENEGIQKFIKAFDSILAQLAKERERALSGR